VMMAELIENTIDAIPGEIFCMQTLLPHDNWNVSNPLLEYKAVALDPDTMYFHHAMQAPDNDEFIRGMQIKMDGQMEDGNFSIIHRKDIPTGETIFHTVWQMRH
jgi:hypothetical protein